MKQTLENRVAVVTGCSAGIGLAVAEHFVELGCRVVINARRAERLQEVAKRLNSAASTRRVLPVVGDANDDSTIRALFDAARLPSGFGQTPDIVVVNAGRGLAGSVISSDPGQWEDMIRTNLFAAAKLMRVAVEHLSNLVPTPDGEEGMSGPWLNKPRDIVLLGSVVGRNISPFSSMYGSTKFALHALAEGLRREVGPKGIRVTTIEPAIVESEFQGVAGYDPANFGSFMRRIGPVLQPSDVAEAIAHVVSMPAHVHIANLLIRPTRQEYP